MAAQPPSRRRPRPANPRTPGPRAAGPRAAGPRAAGRADTEVRALGQHFLRSRAVADRIVACTGITSRDLVLEIGAGDGVLTAALVARGARVVAVEFDPALHAALAEAFRGDARVQAVLGDVLEVPLPEGPWVAAGNIPYALTAAIVDRLTATHGQCARPPDAAHLVVQREAAERFAGAPYAAETLASLRLKPWWHVEIPWRLRRSDFVPPPSVESVVLSMTRRPRPLVRDEEHTAYVAFLRATFERRPHARDALRRVLTPPQVSRLAADLRFEERAPVSAVRFEQWLGVYRFASLIGRV